MSTTTDDPRIDRLYRDLPAIYRMRDAENGYPLQALLRVVAEQVNAVEDGIAQQYDNWFIETAADWAVPYIADLVGYQPLADASQPSSDGQAASALERVLFPRREVANTIRYRRRKGALALLEALANDVAGWPSHAVEFYRKLGWNQNINHPHERRARLCDIRRMDDLDELGRPFDPIARSVDVRRINSHRSVGRYNIPSVGLFVWRLKSYTVSHTPAHCEEDSGPHCFTFSVLGQNAPLFVRPAEQPHDAPLRKELALPIPIRRHPFDRYTASFYGANRSLAVWADGWDAVDPGQPIPVSAVIPADLTDWYYVPPADHIAIDPHLGRIAFPPGQLPRRGVRVSYCYGFSADLGGGEYTRVISDPGPRDVRGPDPEKAGQFVLQHAEPRFYRVGRGQAFTKLGDALAAWRADKPWDAVIELTDSSVFVEPIQIDVPDNTTLILRAASGVRPVIRLLDWQTDMPDAMAITMGHASRVALEGLLVTGRGVQVSGPEHDVEAVTNVPICAAHLAIRHCTLVPGWGIGPHCEPDRPAEASLELSGVQAQVTIERSILGSIMVHENEVRTDPIPICITDSILDATGSALSAIGALEDRSAFVVLTVKRCTVFGIIQVHAVELAENSIFDDCVHVARRQIGCMRYCYVPPRCRTPRRHACQPDLATEVVRATVSDPAIRAALIAAEHIRLAPQFGSERYGRPDYAQLAEHCADEIKRGADDESEMGVFHDLYQPQRTANLEARLAEFTPAGTDAAVINAS
jgi:hypothetical protein